MQAGDEIIVVDGVGGFSYIAYFEKATNINPEKENKIVVYSHNQTIYIDVPFAKTTFIADMTGRCLAKNVSSLYVRNPGIYLIKVDNEVFKLDVK